MWIVRWFFILLVLVIVLTFVVQNSTEQRVIIKFFNWKSGEISFVFAMFLAFVMGLAVRLMISIYHDLKLRSEIAIKNRQIRSLEKELSDLRNEPIRELSEITEPSQEETPEV